MQTGFVLGHGALQSAQPFPCVCQAGGPQCQCRSSMASVCFFFPMVVTSTLRPLCKDDSDVPQLQTNLITGKLMSLVQEGLAGEQQLHRPLPAFQRERETFYHGTCSVECLQCIRRLDVVLQGHFFLFLKTLTLLFSFLINTKQHQVQQNRILLLLRRRCHHFWRVCQRSRRFFYMAFKRTARAGRSSKVSKRSSPTVRWMQTMPRSSERLGNHSTR